MNPSRRLKFDLCMSYNWLRIIQSNSRAHPLVHVTWGGGRMPRQSPRILVWFQLSVRMLVNTNHPILFLADLYVAKPTARGGSSVAGNGRWRNDAASLRLFSNGSLNHRTALFPCRYCNGNSKPEGRNTRFMLLPKSIAKMTLRRRNVYPAEQIFWFDFCIKEASRKRIEPHLTVTVSWMPCRLYRNARRASDNPITLL